MSQIPTLINIPANAPTDILQVGMAFTGLVTALQRWVYQVASTLNPAALGPAGQLPGTATNDSAAAGNVGQFVSASVAAGSALALTTATALDITSISLTAGDWDVEGLLGLREVGGPSISIIDGWINSASVTLPNLANSGARTTWSIPVAPTADMRLALGRTRFSLSATTSLFLSTNCTFAGGTSLSGYGRIEARRVR